MKLIFALLFILLILILTYYIYKNSSIYYAKTNKESLICKVRCSSRTSIFFLVFSAIIILLLINEIMNFSTFNFYYLFAFMYLPQYILFLLSDTTIFIFYVETIYSNGREKLIESLKTLLDENIELIY